MGRKSKKEDIYVSLIHFVVQQKLTQHCNNTPIKKKKEKKKKKNNLALEERKGKKKDVRYISMMDTSN